MARAIARRKRWDAGTASPVAGHANVEVLLTPSGPSDVTPHLRQYFAPNCTARFLLMSRLAMPLLSLCARSATRRSLMALSIACLGACSGGTSSSNTNDMGGSGSSAVNGSGGTPASSGVETGGTTTRATSGAAPASTAGGTSSASGATTAAGGTATSSVSRTESSGAKGGTSAKGGSGSQTGGAGGASTGTTGGVSAKSGSGSQTGGTGGASVGGAATGGSSANDNRSPGCGTPISRPNPRTQQTLSIGGTTRYYLLDVPSSADNQTPLMLIFGLHGYDMNNVAVIDRYNFTSRSGGTAITVLPQGEGPAPGDVSHWGDQVLKSTWSGNESNYNFIRTLMTDLESRFCIDKNRVFIAGFSMGGFFTNALACAHRDWFRAFAPISGGVAGTSCADASVKPPIMIHHGTADTIVEFSSGEATRDYWTKQNGCGATSKSSYTGCESYDTCAQPVIFCVGNWDHDITGTVTGNIWTFFNGFK